jgi:hypothetical protein
VTVMKSTCDTVLSHLPLIVSSTKNNQHKHKRKHCNRHSTMTTTTTMTTASIEYRFRRRASPVLVGLLTLTLLATDVNSFVSTSTSKSVRFRGHGLSTSATFSRRGRRPKGQRRTAALSTWGSELYNAETRSQSALSGNNETVNGGAPPPTGTTLTLETETESPPPQLESLLSEVDILYESRSPLVFDPVQERYVKRSRKKDRATKESTASAASSFLRRFVVPRLSVAFLPSGVTPNYYRYMRWRVVQRFVNSNLHVFGTQSLLMGLNIKTSGSQLGALSAALKWVLKDALGKLVRMLWASKMGRKFDNDARRWRYRSAFCFAAGNGLEIVTYIFPQFFLLFATLANCCKQVSMLTSSSTRTSIYNSFRDGSRENIGDITAKGEAQIAIVDLLGIASGVSLSRALGTSVRSVLAAYVGLQALEIVCMYRQLRSVEYRVLNFERMVQVIGDFVEAVEVATTPNGITAAVAAFAVNGDKRSLAVLVDGAPPGIPTPQQMAVTERIFLPPKRLARRSKAFGSLGRAKLSPTELEKLLHIFRRERFILVVGANVKHPNGRPHSHSTALQENCHIVLHSEATNVDIVKSTLALILLRRKLAASQFDPAVVRSTDCMDLIESSSREADQLFIILLRQLSKQGWESPARFMFGRVHMRAEWPLPASRTATPRPAAT